MKMLRSIMENHNRDNMPWDKLKLCSLHDRTLRSQAASTTCGRILLHSQRQIDAFRERIGISVTVFKIGVTSSPMERYMDYLCKHFTEMWIIYRGSDLGLVHMLEAALIAQYHTVSGCRNASHSGGEGALNRKVPLDPPYFVYVAGGRADRFVPFG